MLRITASRPVVVITGASAGIGANANIGAALARTLSPTHDLVLVARRAHEIAALAATLPNPVLTLAAEVTNREAMAQVVADTLAHYGRLDVWVNNVGHGITRMPSELTDDDLDEMLRVNVRSALYAMQLTLPHFKSVGRGHVINVSSLSGRMPFALFRAAYSASKHFLNALTANFRTEVQSTHPDIQYSIVSPGVVRPELGPQASHGEAEAGLLTDSQSAEEVAAVIATVIGDRRPDEYTQAGSAARVARFYVALGQDP